MAKRRVPRHIGFIPDGNRRWATDRGLAKQDGYSFGIDPGLRLFELCKHAGVDEVSVYCFTKDNIKRPSAQTNAFRKASVAFATEIIRRGAAVLVVGDQSSSQFPAELSEFKERQGGGMKVNLLMNYGWEWDLAGLKDGDLRSEDVSRLDLIVRWGGAVV